jgi:hypothetical protein
VDKDGKPRCLDSFEDGLHGLSCPQLLAVRTRGQLAYTHRASLYAPLQLSDGGLRILGETDKGDDPFGVHAVALYEVVVLPAAEVLHQPWETTDHRRFDAVFIHGLQQFLRADHLCLFVGVDEGKGGVFFRPLVTVIPRMR